ncbi:hypothetical protein VTL71DRAFT_8650 [Oculimacula yallundae]|uniref:Uncharacterized protein n=1 Tax=Oculimacula yallundae TaxID=86028 RepID=A0ABR4CZD3_9HELO
MEGIITLEGPAPPIVACRPQDSTEKSEPLTHESQGFEWIPHDDASARKRARAHVTRCFRRKAIQAQQVLKGGSETAKTRKRGSGTGSKKDAITTVVKGVEAQPREGIVFDNVVANFLHQGMILQKTLGPDPFAAFPVKLCPREQELLDHFFFGHGPLSFVGDNRPDFQPITKLVFDMGLYGASGFHVILATAANHVAASRETTVSRDGLMHQQIGIALVNRMLSDWKPDYSNESLVSVTLLAMLELMYGTPQNFNTHMDGLAVMLKLRGGLESLREKDLQVYSLIHWFDYAGSCNVISRRRFQTKQHSDRLRSSPEGVPEDFFPGLPASYDLCQELMCTFDRLHTMTTVVNAPDSSEEQRRDVFDAVRRTDAALYQSISIPDTEFNRSRRRHLYESLCLLTLVYTSLVTESKGTQTELFIYRFERIWTGEACEWGIVVVGIFRSLMIGDGYHSEMFLEQVLQLVDLSTRLAWAGWRHIRELLMNFFVWDPACRGQLQDLWKERIEKISPWKETNRLPEGGDTEEDGIHGKEIAGADNATSL